MSLSTGVGRLLSHLHTSAPARVSAPSGVAFARRHVILPKHVSKNAPKGRLLAENEWRGLGVQQSRGWVHYAIHRRRARAAPHRHQPCST